MPVEPASFSVWQPMQPALVKTVLPAVGSPFLYCAGTVAVGAVATVPITVTGVGVTIFPPGFDFEQPAATSRSGSRRAIGARRRTRAESITAGRR